MYKTDQQRIVVESRMKQGYVLVGKTASLVNGLTCYIVTKGKHIMVINSLGYDEHVFGITWNIT